MLINEIDSKIELIRDLLILNDFSTSDNVASLRSATPGGTAGKGDSSSSNDSSEHASTCCVTHASFK
ncbi:hypothetical protein DM826_07370 [Halonotius aquaticus]|uniref:Uncharacterized protein n=1 Tax=Halonotius aquaticus TaxID=2216978 RepID=A0A3A6PU59_9EURY|nr:hypothetical protein DM826_07370 [Halonotius aquaticus]